MANNVFGTPITDATLKKMSEYEFTRITRLDRARVALEMKNAESKDANARKFVEDLRQSYGKDGIMCLIYNATGSPITLTTCCSGYGTLAPSPCPSILANGQWGAFVHGLRLGLFGGGFFSFVYAGKNAGGVDHQWVYSVRTSESGRCLTEIRPGGYYPKPEPGKEEVHWLTVAGIEEHETSVHQAHDSGCSSFASIGGTDSPIFEGIMTLTPVLDD